MEVRIKHFDSNLSGWEEKDEFQAFPLVKLGKDEAWFDGMTFRKLPDGGLDVYVLIHKKDGSQVEERFPYKPMKHWQDRHLKDE